jgi:chromosome segregation ATPase
LEKEGAALDLERKQAAAEFSAAQQKQIAYGESGGMDPGQWRVMNEGVEHAERRVHSVEDREAALRKRVENLDEAELHGLEAVDALSQQAGESVASDVQADADTVADLLKEAAALDTACRVSKQSADAQTAMVGLEERIENLTRRITDDERALAACQQAQEQRRHMMGRVDDLTRRISAACAALDLPPPDDAAKR